MLRFARLALLVAALVLLGGIGHAQRDPLLGLRNCEAHNAAQGKQYDCSIYCRSYEYYKKRPDYEPPMPPECERYIGRKGQDKGDEGCTGKCSPGLDCWLLVSDPPVQTCAPSGSMPTITGGVSTSSVYDDGGPKLMIPGVPSKDKGGRPLKGWIVRQYTDEVCKWWYEFRIVVSDQLSMTRLAGASQIMFVVSVDDADNPQIYFDDGVNKYFHYFKANKLYYPLQTLGTPEVVAALRQMFNNIRANNLIPKLPDAMVHPDLQGKKENEYNVTATFVHGVFFNDSFKGTKASIYPRCYFWMKKVHSDEFNQLGGVVRPPSDIPTQNTDLDPE